MWFADLVGGVIVLLLGAAVVILSRQLPYHAEYGPGPGFLPFWLGLGLIACGAVILGEVVVRRTRYRGAFFQGGTWRVGLLLASLIAVILLVPLLGLAIGLGLFTAFLMRTVGRHNWALCGLIGVLTVFGIRWIFGSWLQLPLPTGILGW
ncbi:MAG: tripartite tricarboxylate transporter TctB family protein [Armatimonadota bacterium]|nr:tripartite tricarboxylate transporter TctB family protein [Armatimonadota bacterium]MDR5703957.1 tripartite tricarboxylate transporter TctB family protein [Armatimonadota bacterium]MDR7435433.1 tripartite tricarboxylate transporter TctB family protein [Armatimonadota bacterium]